jgi:hypothetical protein
MKYMVQLQVARPDPQQRRLEFNPNTEEMPPTLRKTEL